MEENRTVDSERVIEDGESLTSIERMQKQNLQIQEVKWTYQDNNILSSGIDRLIDLQNHLKDLKVYKDNVKQLEAEDDDLERIIAMKERAIADEVDSVVKKRRSEVTATFDSQIDNTKAEIKKVKSKREKRKSKKVSERIQDETQDIRNHYEQQREKIVSIMEDNGVPRFYNTRLFHALFYPKGLSDIGIDMICVITLFLLLPTIIYRYILQTDNDLIITIIYFCTIIVFGAIYLAINSKIKNKYHETFLKIKEVRTDMNNDKKSINKIKKSIQKDKDESNYGLEKFNKEIKELEKSMELILSKKKESLAEFDKTSRNIIADEIREKNKPELQNLQVKYEEVHELNKEYSNKVKELEMQLASTYEAYLGKEFMNLDKLEKLIKIMETKDSMVVSDALKIYKEQTLNS